MPAKKKTTSTKNPAKTTKTESTAAKVEPKAAVAPEPETPVKATPAKTKALRPQPGDVIVRH